MDYSLDLESIAVQSYKEILKKQNLLPGRRLLLQNIDENFAVIENKGIQNLSQLRKSISSPQKMTSFASESGIPEDYLVILKREMSSLEQKPVLIANFPGIDASLVNKLNKSGVNNSKDYWEHNQSGMDELFSLCDLVRINGVGPLAAKAFYEAGYRSVLEVAEADAALMLEKVSGVNEAQHYYKAKLGLKDMRFCIDFAQLLRRLGSQS
ncbi:helix-hairpin-helix domain-containing protein [Planococcus sp. X10-3]|uniref:helix-hairpin-helix domain-containing protein n=1 Tax=Planococcus sp. X10-3 TaxID=3061240 RepID=UPI003BB18C8D